MFFTYMVLSIHEKLNGVFLCSCHKVNIFWVVSYGTEKGLRLIAVRDKDSSSTIIVEVLKFVFMIPRLSSRMFITIEKRVYMLPQVIFLMQRPNLFDSPRMSLSNLTLCFLRFINAGVTK